MSAEGKMYLSKSKATPKTKHMLKSIIQLFSYTQYTKHVRLYFQLPITVTVPIFIHSIHKACQTVLPVTNHCHCPHLHIHYLHIPHTHSKQSHPLHSHSISYHHQSHPLHLIYSTSAEMHCHAIKIHMN